MIHVLVVGLYLLYTLIEAHHDLRAQGTFYSDLGLSSLGAGDKEIKSRFRRLAAVHHPDKSADGAGGADRFMALKLASDTLLDPAARFAYDRFGPEVTAWQRVQTPRDYLARGVFQSLLPHYGVAAAALYAFGWLGYLNWGRYWRWVLLLALCVFECHLVTRPRAPAALAGLNAALAAAFGTSPYLPFQLVSLARKTSLTLYIAFNQLGPLLDRHLGRSDDDGRQAELSEEEALRKGLDRLELMSKGLDADADKMLGLEMVPFAGDQDTLRSIQGKVKDWLVQNTIRSDPMVRDAVGNSFKKRRADAPAGARGNR